MSDLLVDRLETTLTQKVTPTETVILGAIRPHIYIENSPTGSLRMDIYDSADSVLLKSSESFTIAQIKSNASITQAYFHGYVRFYINWGLVAGTTYSIRLVGHTGYTYDATNAIWWCKDFDLRKYSANYTPSAGFNSAFDVEFWDYNDNMRNL